MLGWFKKVFFSKKNSPVAYLFVTLPSHDLAVSVAKKLLEKRLVACVSIFPVISIFSWEGKICEQSEIKLLLKSRASLFPDITSLIREMSPYDITEITLLIPEKVDKSYLNWLLSMTSKEEH